MDTNPALPSFNTLPDLCLACPDEWTAHGDSDSEELLGHTLQWAERFDLAPKGSAAQRCLVAVRPDLFARLAYPDATDPAAQVVSDFVAWALLLDEELVELDVLPGQEARLERLFDRYLNLLIEPPQVEAPVESPLLAACRDLGGRLQRLASAAWMGRFCASMRDYFYRGVGPETELRQDRRWPGLLEYTELRPHTCAAFPLFDLLELGIGRELPSEVTTHPMLTKLRRSAAIAISWTKDLFSHAREREEPFSLSLPRVLMKRLGLSETAALDSTVNLHDIEVRTLLTLVDELPSFDPETDRILSRWSKGLGIFVRGFHEWQRRATRSLVPEGLCPSMTAVSALDEGGSEALAALQSAA